MRRPNKTTVLGASLLLLAATAAWGLGLGDLQVESGLGQPFSATIPLRMDSPSELNGLTVGLADAFSRAGVERSAAAELLRFAVDAKHVPPRIVVSSARPINEPFINFLVSARSSDGVLSREYTVLLNPASYGKQAAIASSAAPVSRVVANPVSPSPPLPAASSPTPSPPSSMPVARPAEAAVAPRRFGPVRPGQTFWSIAERVRPDPSISMDQVLLAIYAANPRAFSAGRFNGLMKGRVLEIPDAAEMRATAPAEAAARVRHLRAQVAAAATVPGASPSVVSKPAAPAPVATGEPVPVSAPESPAAPPETAAERLAARVPAVSTADAGLPASAADGPASSQPQPASDAAPSASAASAGVAEGAAPVASASPAVPKAGGNDVAAVDGGPAPSSMDTATATTAATGQAPATGATRSVPSSTAPRRVTLKHDADKTVRPSHSPTFFSTLLAGPNLRLVGGVAIVVLLLGWLAQRRRQQPVHDVPLTMLTPVSASGPRPAPHIGAVEFPDVEQDAAPAVPVRDAAALAAELEAEDQKPTPGQSLPDAGGFDKVPAAAATTAASEGDDPVADAEFHLAYGLYDEAIPLLEKAVAQHPGNADLQVKLAQTYASAGKAEAFEALAESLHGRVSAEAWQGLATLGRKLCPGVALFAAGVGGSALGFGADHAGLAAPAMDGPATEPVAVSPAQAEELPPVAADITLPELPEVAEDPARQPDNLPDAPGDNVIEFDPEPGHDALTEPAAVLADPHGGDIEAMVAEGLAAADEVAQGMPAADAGARRPAAADVGHSVNFNLEDFDIDMPGATTAAGAAGKPDDALDLGPITFNLGDQPASGTDAAGQPEPQAPDLAHGADAIPSTAPPVDGNGVVAGLPDEAIPEGVDYSGKLDLAQIYASMGENDAAREVAREVLQHGDAELRAAAEKLLATLAG